jgi:hypothetical protein
VELGERSLSIDSLARLAQVLGLRELERLLTPYTTSPKKSAKPAVAGSKASRRSTSETKDGFR